MNISHRPFRILHTADWHLGKLLGDQSRDQEHCLFLDWLFNVIQKEEIDELLIAGDIFDTATPPNLALERYYSFISRLHHLGTCSLTVVAGNHDSPAQLEAPKELLRALGVEVAGILAEDPKDRILLLPRHGQPRVALALVPFLRDRDLRVGRFGDDREEIRKELVEGIRARYQESLDAFRTMALDCPLLGTGHLTVLGSSTSDSERSIHIGGLGAVTPDIFPPEFSYVALGHIHRPQSLGDKGRVRYSGSPIPLSFSEARDQKSVQVIEVQENTLEFRTLEIPQFRKLVRINVPVTNTDQALRTLVLEPGALESWVEVTLQGSGFVEEAIDQLRTYSEDKGYRILKVLREEKGGVLGLGQDSEGDTEALSRVSLLDSPIDVFDLLLTQRGLNESEEYEGLRLVFRSLVEEVTQ